MKALATVGLGMAFAAGLVLSHAAEAAVDSEEAGRVSAVTIQAQGFPPALPIHTLAIGTDVMRNERVDTDSNGVVQFLFLDGSTFTLSRNSSVTIDDFIYDPNAEAGHLSMSLSHGLFRLVGGKLTKSGSVTLKTPSAVLAVRGGIVLVEVGTDGATRVTMLYGEALTISTATSTTIIRRPGFSAVVAANGITSAPTRAPGDQVAREIDGFAPPPGAAPPPPPPPPPPKGGSQAAGASPAPAPPPPQAGGQAAGASPVPAPPPPEAGGQASPPSAGSPPPIGSLALGRAPVPQGAGALPAARAATAAPRPPQPVVPPLAVNAVRSGSQGHPPPPSSSPPSSPPPSSPAPSSPAPPSPPPSSPPPPSR
jgi:hypothetical protein